MKRIGVKYCGGCNPAYDRVGYLRRVQVRAGGRIEWVRFDGGGYDTLVIVTGCDKACVEGVEYEKAGCRVVRVRHGMASPEELVSLLLEEGESHD